MSNEASKAKDRVTRYISGRVLDIGAGTDPVVPSAQIWEVADGDAQYLDTLPDETYDTVFSSHCLEHMRNPLEALLNWYRVLKPGGHLIVIVPDEDLYEQHRWPSFSNDDHKWSYTPHKDASWAPQTANLLDLVRHLYRHKLISLTIQDTGYDYTKPFEDQTQTTAEAACEIIVRKQVVEDGVRLSPYDHNVLCPKCGGQMVVLGIKDGTMDVQCYKCGARGTTELKNFA